MYSSVSQHGTYDVTQSRSGDSELMVSAYEYSPSSTNVGLGTF
jgi:hypothetical protein